MDDAITESPQTKRIRELEAQVERLQRTTQTLTCVYCGQEYPPNTPASGSPALTAHIKVCEKHPMRKLRAALARLVGADGAAGLDAMEIAMRGLPAPSEDKAAMIDAITALKETL